MKDVFNSIINMFLRFGSVNGKKNNFGIVIFFVNNVWGVYRNYFVRFFLDLLVRLFV